MQTRAPTINVFGPAVTSLLSRPITPHEIGVIVSIGAALVILIELPIADAAISMAAITRRARLKIMYSLLIRFKQKKTALYGNGAYNSLMDRAIKRVFVAHTELIVGRNVAHINAPNGLFRGGL